MLIFMLRKVFTGKKKGGNETWQRYLMWQVFTLHILYRRIPAGQGVRHNTACIPRTFYDIGCYLRVGLGRIRIG